MPPARELERAEDPRTTQVSGCPSFGCAFAAGAGAVVADDGVAADGAAVEGPWWEEWLEQTWEWRQGMEEVHMPVLESVHRRL